MSPALFFNDGGGITSNNENTYFQLRSKKVGNYYQISITDVKNEKNDKHCYNNKVHCQRKTFN